MSFSGLLNKVDQYVKLAPWLQMVGVILCAIGVGFTPGHVLGAKGVAFLGLGIAIAGRLYNEVYP